METTLTTGNQMNDANYMTIVRVRVDALRPSRVQAHTKVTDHRVGLIAQSFRRRGQLTAILITPDNEIVAGHNRWNAAKKVGWTHINATVTTEDPDTVFVDEHPWGMDQKNWAGSVGRGLSVALVQERQKVTAENIQKSAKLFGGISTLNDLGYPPTAHKTVMRVFNALNARIDPENVPTTRALAKWVTDHDMLKVCSELLKPGRPFPAKKLLTAISRNKPLDL